jgi:hypothetical protein
MIGTALAMWRGRRTTGPTPGAQFAPAKLALQGTIVGGFTGLVGAGGGFLIVPALALWGGLPMPAAVGTSLVVIVVNCLAGFVGYSTHVAIDWGLVATIAAIAVAGSYFGSILSHKVDPASLRRAFAGFVLAMGAMILVREGQLVVETTRNALPTTWPQLAFVLLALGIGIAAGRASRSSGTEGVSEFNFLEGDGI